MGSVQNPFLILLYWLVDKDSQLDCYYLIMGSIIPQLIINQLGFRSHCSYELVSPGRGNTEIRNSDVVPGMEPPKCWTKPTISVQKNMHSCMYRIVYMHVYIYTYIYIYMIIYVCMYMYVYIYIHTYTYIYICTHMYMYIYIYLPKHTHTCICV